METTKSLKFFLEYLGEHLKNHFINTTKGKKFFKYSGYSINIHPDPEDDSEFGTLEIVAYLDEDAINEDELRYELNNYLADAHQRDAINWVMTKIKKRYHISDDAGLKSDYSWVFITQVPPCNLLAVQLKDSSIHIVISRQA